ncbi:sex-determining region Y protein-like [Sabethes cyaneus]|uniref:sex-determining region Y protein-like n=1 Tax=Sabethes cyaneus TaxID=53552 RepID=UPI00237D76B2|nr:sex-determining region Y protein-like [Sabethes cyaneus]
MKAFTAIILTLLVIVPRISADSTKEKRSVAEHGSQLGGYNNHVLQQQQQRAHQYSAPVVQDHYSQYEEHHSSQQHWSQPDELLNGQQQYEQHAVQHQPDYESFKLHTSVRGQEVQHHPQQHEQNHYEADTYEKPIQDNNHYEKPIQANNIEYHYPSQHNQHDSVSHQELGHNNQQQYVYEAPKELTKEVRFPVESQQHRYPVVHHEQQQQHHVPAHVPSQVPYKVARPMPYPAAVMLQHTEQPMYKDINVVHIPKPVAVHVEKPYPVYMERPVYVEKPIPLKVVILREKNKSWWSKLL